MHYEIRWNTASVKNERLIVLLSEPPVGTPAPTPQTAWGSLFNQIANRQIPGVSYSLSYGWGPVQLSQGTIFVDAVSDRAVEGLKAHLDAAVATANQEHERLQQEKAREATQRRKEEQVRAERDKGMTARFRASGNQ